jgi:hypothetical protein
MSLLLLGEPNINGSESGEVLDPVTAKLRQKAIKDLKLDQAVGSDRVSKAARCR